MSRLNWAKAKPGLDNRGQVIGSEDDSWRKPAKSSRPVIRSKYSGICKACGNRWGPGTLITVVSGAKDSGWKHKRCPKPLSDIIDV